MNKKRTFILILIFFSYFCLFNINYVYADTGWNITYNGGSAASESLSIGHSSTSSGNVLLIIIVWIAITIAVIMNMKKHFEKQDELKKEQNVELNKLSKKYLNKSLDKVIEKISSNFIDIQEAYMNFDYKKLKKLCTSDMYNKYYSELELLKNKNEQNIMDDLSIWNIKINEILNDKGNIEIKCEISVTLYDYVINNITNKVVSGKKGFEIDNTYDVVFMLKKIKKVSKCPNCAKKINSDTTKCEHCKKKISNLSNEIIMSEIKIMD